MAIASRTRVPDAPSGFRAIHREAALRLCVFNDYTYTLETILQAGRKNIPVTSVPVGVNEVTRSSRLVKSTPSYVRRSLLTILRIFVLYKPLRFFVAGGTLFLLPGIAIGMRFLVAYFDGRGGGHVQSLILAAVLIVTAVVIYAAGIIADLVAANRVLLEEVRMRLLRAEVSRSRESRALWLCWRGSPGGARVTWTGTSRPVPSVCGSTRRPLTRFGASARRW